MLWIFRDQFGKFKIGKWTLAEAGLDLSGTMGPGKPLEVSVKPWVGQLLKPGVTEEIRARTQAEREMAEKLASAGAAGSPVARKVLRAPGDDPRPATRPPAAARTPRRRRGGCASRRRRSRASSRRRRCCSGGQQARRRARGRRARGGRRSAARCGGRTTPPSRRSPASSRAPRRAGGGAGSFTLESEPKIEE